MGMVSWFLPETVAAVTTSNLLQGQTNCWKLLRTHMFLRTNQHENMLPLSNCTLSFHCPPQSISAKATDGWKPKSTLVLSYSFLLGQKEQEQGEDDPSAAPNCPHSHSRTAVMFHLHDPHQGQGPPALTQHRPKLILSAVDILSAIQWKSVGGPGCGRTRRLPGL